MMDQACYQQLVNINAELVAINQNLQRIIEPMYVQNQSINNLDQNQRLFR